jgi:glycerol-3-phosphate dehydrogenase (NAD(P)+)
LTRLGIVGAGSWGTALSIVLAPRFHRVTLWAYDPGLAHAIEASRENTVYLPGFTLPDNVTATDSLADAANQADCLLLVVPSQHFRRIAHAVLETVSHDPVLVSATKGIEAGTLLRMSQILRETRPQARIAVLSGPTFAREIAAGEPAAVVVASDQAGIACAVQQAFSGPTLRLYTNGDPAGVEVGAALKNVIAIGAGIVQGLGLGNNTNAALVTRGLAEITRLAVACGGQEKTLSGLAGLGDLLLTCTGDLSRNRRVGIELAKGRRLDEILASTKMIAEGVETTVGAVALARRHGVEMPIVEQMDLVLRSGKPPREAMRDLMDRALRSE